MNTETYSEIVVKKNDWMNPEVSKTLNPLNSLVLSTFF